MATATELATKALRRIRVLGSEDTGSSADIEAAKEALSEMLASWEAKGLSGDVLPLSGRFDGAITAMLAVRLAEEYGKEPGAILLRDADDGWKSLRAAFFVVPDSRFDSALRRTGHYATADFVYGQDAGQYSEWQAATAYVVRQFVTYLGNEYECTTAGTSGSSGPAGTDTTITDGTVTWCWRRAVE